MMVQNALKSLAILSPSKPENVPHKTRVMFQLLVIESRERKGDSKVSLVEAHRIVDRTDRLLVIGRDVRA